MGSMVDYGTVFSGIRLAHGSEVTGLSQAAPWGQLHFGDRFLYVWVIQQILASLVGKVLQADGSPPSWAESPAPLHIFCDPFQEAVGALQFAGIRLNVFGDQRLILLS